MLSIVTKQRLCGDVFVTARWRGPRRGIALWIV